MIDVTLVAPTPQEAYMLAKEKYGSDFKILSAKQILDSENGSIICEIKISIPKDSFLQLSQKEDERELIDEITLLKEQIIQMKIDKASSDPKSTPIEKVKTLFSKKGIDAEWLDERLEPFFGSNIAEDESHLVSYLLEEIDDAIEIKQEDFSKQKIMMFVGPTGVGKTTTVAKLAARYAYMLEESHSVAIINLDSFKIGAFEQLSSFAKIMKLQHFEVNCIDEFQEVFIKAKGYDIVLIDTAGMSPFDTDKLIKTVEYLSTNSTQDIEVNLVISATIKYEDAKDIHEIFSFLNLDSLILSKFDETKHLGSIISYLLLHPIKLSYFSVGQEVPDDLVVADKEYLLQRFIGDLNG